MMLSTRSQRFGLLAVVVGTVGLLIGTAAGIPGATADRSGAAQQREAAAVPGGRPLDSSKPDPLLNAYGFTRDDLMAATRTRSGKALYITSDQENACIVDIRGTGQCTSHQGVAKGFTFGAEMCMPDLAADKLRITGIVPDGVSAVTLSMPDGTTSTTTASKGAVTFEMPRTTATAATAQVTWATPAGKTDANVPLSPDALTAVCD